MTVGAQAHSIRDYSKPPVIETVISVQFLPVKGLSNLLFGLYWRKIRSEFPHSELRPPLGQVTEEFGSRSRRLVNFGIEVTQEPDLRCWFLDSGRNQIIQVQRDRFIYNWQKVSGNEIYPRYETIREKFLAEWGRFIEFLGEEKLSVPVVNQCEVTYVNHIEYDQGWKTFGELDKVISPWSGKYSGNFLPAPEKVGLSSSYILPDNQGRLHVSMQPVIRTRDAREVLQLSLTARGAPASSDTKDIMRWIDLGRQWVVEGFTDFTTAEFHALWERKK
ncbi:MAG: hypothetical protein LZF60_160159 [Nitrospira sp.]|nr:MAG: hypothetical protein LZF60_160159 [Nitrospira sp.]